MGMGVCVRVLAPCRHLASVPDGRAELCAERWVSTDGEEPQNYSRWASSLTLALHPGQLISCH